MLVPAHMAHQSANSTAPSEQMARSFWHTARRLPGRLQGICECAVKIVQSGLNRVSRAFQGMSSDVVCAMLLQCCPATLACTMLHNS